MLMSPRKTPVRFSAWAAAALALAAPAAAWAGHVPNPTEPYDLTHARTYSNVCAHPETGDLLGLRIFVQANGRTPRVVAQYAEGELTQLIPARSHATPAGLAFVLPGDLSGEIHRRYALVRPHAPGSKPFRLPLRDDTHGFPDCRYAEGR